MRYHTAYHYSPLSSCLGRTFLMLDMASLVYQKLKHLLQPSLII